MALQYFNGQGKVYIGTRDSNGNPEALRWVGNCPTFKFMLEESVEEHKESYSGNRLTDVRLTTELKASVEMELEQIDADNLNVLLFATTVSQTTGSVTGETVGTSGIAVGDVYILDKQNITTSTGFSITDSTTGTPKTLTADTNYEVNGAAGMIELLNLTTGGPFVGPLTAAYDYGAQSISKLFGTNAVEYWVRFVGVNTAVSGSPAVTVDLYRCRISPAEEVGLITDEIAKFPMKGSVLADDTKTQAGDWGQFGRMILEV